MYALSSFEQYFDFFYYLNVIFSYFNNGIICSSGKEIA
jgi:hypothetical protein